MSSNATNEAFSFYWWVISVVFAGILINLFSAYVKPWLDAVLSSISSRWRNRVEVKKRAYEVNMQKYLENPSLITILAINATHSLLIAAFFMLGGFMVLMLSTVSAEAFNA